jgi:hypothetical protein
MGTEKKESVRRNSGAAQEELGRELRHLRGLVREAGESFILRREGEIEAIIGHLSAVPPSVLRAQAPEWLRKIHSLRLKPAKGRLKDLKGIDALVEELAERVISAQEGQRGAGRKR